MFSVAPLFEVFFKKSGHIIGILLNILGSALILFHLLNINSIEITNVISLTDINFKICKIIFCLKLLFDLKQLFIKRSYCLLNMINGFSTILVLLIFGTSNLLVYLVTFFLLMLNSVVLLGFTDKNNPKALRYFITTIMAGFILFLGGVLFYFSTHSLSLVNLSVMNADLFCFSVVCFYFVALFATGVFPFYSQMFEVFKLCNGDMLFSYFFIHRIAWSYTSIKFLQRLLIECPVAYQAKMVEYFSYLPFISMLYIALLSISLKNIKEIFACFAIFYGSFCLIGFEFDYDYFQSKNIFSMILVSSFLITFPFISLDTVLKKHNLSNFPVSLKGLKEIELSWMVIFGYFLISLISLPMSFGFQTKVLFLADLYRDNFNYEIIVVLFSMLIISYWPIKMLIKVFVLNSDYEVKVDGLKKQYFAPIIFVSLIFLGIFSDSILNLIL